MATERTIATTRLHAYWCPRCKIQTERPHHMCESGPPLFPQMDEWTTCEEIPVIPAVLSEELVEKVARAWAEEIGGGGLFAPDAEFPGEAERNTVFRQGLLRDTRVLLRAAGFVSEPSAGDES